MMQRNSLQTIMDLASNLGNMVNPVALGSQLMRAGSDKLMGKRNDEVMRLLSTHTDSPHELLAAINRLQAAQASGATAQATQLPELLRKAMAPATNYTDERLNRRERQ
jgi:hypothetical protein